MSEAEPADRTDLQRLIFKNDSQKPASPHALTLNEIQIRAYRVRREHGEVGGGYTLDEWLEAEHQLNEELRESSKKKDEKPH